MAKRNRQVSEARAKAIHEAAHAVVADQLHIDYAKVSIAPGEQSLGHAVLANYQREFRDVESKPTLKQKDLAERLAVLACAGPLAERKYRGKLNQALDDRSGATEFLGHFHDGTGKAFAKYCTYVWALADDHVRHPEHWFYIKTVADALFEHKTLEPAKVRGLIADAWKGAVLYSQSLLRRMRRTQKKLDAESAKVVDDFFG
jgi:hypothetical protein